MRVLNTPLPWLQEGHGVRRHVEDVAPLRLQHCQRVPFLKALPSSTVRLAVSTLCVMRWVVAVTFSDGNGSG